MFVDPSGLSGNRNAVAIIGLNGEYASGGFYADIETWENDNKSTLNGNVRIFDANDYKDSNTPMDDMMEDIAQYSYDVGGIDVLLYAGHSYLDGLSVFYGHDNVEYEMRSISKNTDWSSINFNSGANIKLMGCNAGGTAGYKNFLTKESNGEDILVYYTSIAQNIADKTGVTVWAFTNYTQNTTTENGVYQIPTNYGGEVGRSYRQSDTNVYHTGFLNYNYTLFTTTSGNQR